MKRLYLFDNSIMGWINNEIRNLKYLVFLWFYNNKHNHLVDPQHGRLKKVQELSLIMNGFQFDIPPTISKMKDLEDLCINEHLMKEKIPEGLCWFRKLKYVRIQDTFRCNWPAKCVADAKMGIKETICAKIGNSRKLPHVLINNNPLGGSCPQRLDSARTWVSF